MNQTAGKTLGGLLGRPSFALGTGASEMKAALEGYKFIPPHIEYVDRMTLHIGERTFELMHMKGVHSEADTAIWLPKKRVLFSASAFVSEQINIFRPFVNISDIQAAGKMLKALNPEHVIPGHGPPPPPSCSTMATNITRCWSNASPRR